MLETRSNIYNVHGNCASGSGSSHSFLLNQAINLFNWARRDTLLEKTKCAFLRRFCGLLDLHSIPTHKIRTQRYGGIRPVSLNRICGTLGRTGDFDHHFHPLDDRLRDRWVSLAIARFQNLPLAPVELIQVGNCYFVKDGHHRISVAHCLGEAAIDAEITVWDVCGPLPWETQSTARLHAQAA